MMYSVYADGKTIYNESWLRVGEYGKSTEIIDPVLTLEDNEAGSFEFSMPQDNQAYSTFKRITSEIKICEVVFDTNNKAKVETEIWRGRAVTENEDFEHNRVFTCEGELNYLKDTRQPQKKYLKVEGNRVRPKQYFTSVLNIHNSKVAENKRFYMGNCEYDDWDQSEAQYQKKPKTESTVTSSIDDYESEEDKYIVTKYEDTLSCIRKAFDDLKQPHIKIRWSNGKRYLDILKDVDVKSSSGVSTGSWGKEEIKGQEVRLGVNLLDCSKNYDMSELASVIIPLGAQKEGDKAYLGDPYTVVYAKPTEGHNGGWCLAPENNDWGVVAGTPYEVTSDANFHLCGPIKDFKVGDKLFYTGSNINGYGMYTFMNSKPTSECSYGTVVQKCMSNTARAWEDSRNTEKIEEVITWPDGADALWIASYGDAPQLRLNRYLTEKDEKPIENYITVSEVEDKTEGQEKQKGTYYVTNKNLMKTYGWIETVIEFPKITDPKLLYDRTLKYFKEDMFENLVLEVKVLDMSTIDKDAESFKIGKCVHVISDAHDIDTTFPISKLELHFGSPENSLVTLGKKKKKNFTGITTSTSAAITKTVTENAQATNSRTLAALDEASNFIKNGMNGYVSLVRDDPPNDNIIREIVISTELPYTSKTAKVWRWNVNGLGFSPTGYNDENFNTNVAITADGRIAANLIEGGVLKIGRGGFVGSRMELHSIIINKQNQEKDKITALFDENGIHYFNYDYEKEFWTSLGITNGLIKGFQRYGEDSTGINEATRIGTLNLARKDGEAGAYKYNASLTADVGSLYINGNNDVIVRAGQSHYGDGRPCEANGTIYLQTWNGERYQNLLYIDANGLHPTGDSEGISKQFTLGNYYLTIRKGLIVGADPVG